MFINNCQNELFTNLFSYQLQLINLVPSDFGEIIIRQKAKWEGNIASSSDNSMDSVQLFTSSDKEVVEGTNSIDKEAPINKIPLKFQNRGKNIQEKRKGLFTYKPFKEDLQPVINPRIELEKRNVTENSNKIWKISWKFSINNGISDIEPIEFELKGMMIKLFCLNVSLNNK